MRIWSIHPKYLDAKGLTALWRETLLAKKVLEGKTKGYKNHPQLTRFKNTEKPMELINTYLIHVAAEADKRSYNFDKNKIGSSFTDNKIAIGKGQIKYEFNHLCSKLKKRDIQKFNLIKNIKNPEPHPVFNIADGSIEPWEKIS
jgi:hypothetical protein